MRDDARQGDVEQRRAIAQQIDQICDAFEGEWRKGGGPNIEVFLQRAEKPQREALLRELILTEAELRKQAGEVVRLSDYAKNYPQLAPWLRMATADHEILAPADSAAAPAGRGDRTSKDQSPLDLCPLFRAVPRDVLLGQMSLRSFRAGEALLRQGEQGDSLLVIAEGHVEIRSTAPDGRQLAIDRAGRGDVLGEMALLSREPRTADAWALDDVAALVLSADRFHDLARRYPELSVVLSELVSKRLGKPQRDALTDKVLDEYRIVRRLGRGGMGIVYQAERMADGRLVALKMMSHRLVYDRVAREQFEQEAKIIQSLRHPNIVQTHGRFAAFHTYFLVLEFCPGRTLDEVLATEGPLCEADARPILGQLAAALAYAHRAGVLHRDLKPANVMLTGDGCVKLMDFGLAEPVNAPSRFGGRIVGTPRYMAPEQRSGQQVDARADYFSFGCLAYELLAGRPLFEGSSDEELVRDFRGWEPPLLKPMRPELSDELSSAIALALCPEVSSRQLDLECLASWHPCDGSSRTA
jgi:CRP-like cAMP-binding protein